MNARRDIRALNPFLNAAVVVTVAALAACSSGGSAKPSGPSATATIPSGGGSVQIVPATGQALNVNFPAGSVPAGTSVTVTSVSQSSLPAALPSALTAEDLASNALTSASNAFVTAFHIDVGGGVTQFNAPVAVNGTGMTSSLQLTTGTVLNVARLQNNAWVDVATALTDKNGAFTTQHASVALPGVLGPGYYLVYQPAPGTSTAVANFGIALIADDGNGSKHGLQVVNLLDSMGDPLATPTMAFLEFPDNSDLDGQALTPDGSQGVLVDGGNTVRFFNAVNTGVPIASTNTVDVGAYGGDGDAIAIMPKGDEAVVSADSPSQLLLISGITSGNPKAAEVISIPDYRDSLVISADGKTMLARGSSGVTVFSITQVAAKAGSLGGTVTSVFEQLVDLPTSSSTPGAATIASANGEDGRGGMAFDPTNSTRAVVIGSDYSATGSGQVIQLLTGLDTASPKVSSLSLAGVSSVSAVSFTPRGNYAVLGMDSGLVLVSIAGGTLTQVNTIPFNPNFTVAGTQYTLGNVPTLGITLDGMYVVALTQNGQSGTNSTGSGTLLVVPIPTQPTAQNAFGNPVGQLDGVAVPDNDQILMH